MTRPVDPAPASVPASDRRHRQESMLSVGASAAVFALALVTGPLLAQTLGAQGRGDLAAVLVPTQLLYWALNLGVPTASAYYSARLPARDLYTSAWVVGLAVRVPAGCLVWLLAPSYLDGYDPRTVLWLRIGLAVGLVVTPMFTALEMMRALGGAGLAYNLLRAAGPVMNFTILVLLALFGRLTLETALAAAVTSNVGHVLLVVLLRRAWPRPPWRRAVGALQLRYGLRSAVGDVSGLLVARLDQLLMVGLVDPSRLGIYVVAVTAATVSTPLAQGLAAALFPHMLHADAGEQAARLRSALGWTAVVGVLAAAIVATTAPFLLPWAFGAAFSAALTPLWLLLPGQLCLNLSTVRSSALQAQGRPGWASIASLASAAVTVAGVVPAVSTYGIEGAAALTSVSQAVQLLVLLGAGAPRHGSTA